MRLTPVGCLFTLLLAVSFFSPATPAAERTWNLAVSPHFELFTTESAGRARDAIVRFEQIRAFFIQASTSLRTPGYRVRIVAFRSESEYRPYSPMTGSAAYYQPGVHHDTIVMKGLGAEELPIATHEFVHLVLYNSKAKPPLWFNEGLAELYSTLKPAGRNSLLVGDMLPGRLAFLARLKRWDVEAVLSTDQRRLAGASRDEVASFYALSWALTHMIALSDQYRPNFARFMSEMFAGADTKATFQKVYGRSAGDVALDLRGYLEGSMFKAFVYPFGLDKQAEEPEVRAATALEWGVALADLYAGRPAMAGMAVKEYSKLAAESPGRWEPVVGLAYASAAMADREAAGRYFARADELGCRDPRVFLHWGMYAPPGGLASSAAKLFRKAVELAPTDLEIRYRAGLGLAQARDCQAAMGQLLNLKTVTQDQAPDYLKAVIACGPGAGFQREAEVAAKQLMDIARTPGEKAEAERYGKMVPGESAAVAEGPVEAVVMRSEREAAAPEEDAATAEQPAQTAPYVPITIEVQEGLYVQLDCEGANPRLWIQTESGRVAFEIANGNNINLRRRGRPVREDLTCGPQSKPEKVLIRYRPNPDKESATVNVAVAMEFQ